MRTIGSFTALAGVSPMVSWASAPAADAVRGAGARFAFVARASGAIDVYAVAGGGEWSLTQTVKSASPSCLALSPDERFLYVTNAVQSFEHRRTGSVEAYAVDAVTGHLSILNRQPLAVFATAPEQLAVAPNGRMLAVSAGSGAVYNLLPIDGSGRVRAVTASIKPMARGAVSGFSQRLSFPTDRSLLAVDATRSISFAIDDEQALSITEHRAVAGSVVSTPTLVALKFS
jgi:6-phosphogluconolactonase (cycloisomerase 2 family)